MMGNGRRRQGRLGRGERFDGRSSIVDRDEREGSRQSIGGIGFGG